MYWQNSSPDMWFFWEVMWIGQRKHHLILYVTSYCEIISRKNCSNIALTPYHSWGIGLLRILLLVIRYERLLVIELFETAEKVLIILRILFFKHDEYKVVLTGKFKNKFFSNIFPLFYYRPSTLLSLFCRSLYKAESNFWLFSCMRGK